MLQCKSDLRSDEEIFAEKAKEVNTLGDKIAELVSCLLSTRHRVVL